MKETRYRHNKIDFPYDYISLNKALQEGYIPYAGPFRPINEDWQIRRMVDDIVKNKRDKYALIRIGSQIEIYILRNFYLLSNTTAIPYGCNDAQALWKEMNGSNKTTTSTELPGLLADPSNPVFDGPQGKSLEAQEAASSSKSDEGMVESSISQTEIDPATGTTRIPREQLLREMSEEIPAMDAGRPPSVRSEELSDNGIRFDLQVLPRMDRDA